MLFKRFWPSLLPFHADSRFASGGLLEFVRGKYRSTPTMSTLFQIQLSRFVFAYSSALYAFEAFDA